MLQIRSLELLDWLEESAIYPVQGSWLVFLVNSFKSSVVRLLFDQSHSTTASSVILATTAVDTAATNLAAVTDYYGRNATLPIKQYFGPFIISNSVSSSWYGPFINTSFSHTLCLIIGIFICFGLVCFYESLEKKMKNPWPPGSKEVLDIAADITFHFKFAIGER